MARQTTISNTVSRYAFLDDGFLCINYTQSRETTHWPTYKHLQYKCVLPINMYIQYNSIHSYIHTYKHTQVTVHTLRHMFICDQI